MSPEHCRAVPDGCRDTRRYEGLYGGNMERIWQRYGCSMDTGHTSDTWQDTARTRLGHGYNTTRTLFAECMNSLSPPLLHDWTRLDGI